MSVAFHIRLGRSRLLERLARLPWMVVSAVAAVLVADRSQSAWPLWLGLVAGLAILTWPRWLPAWMGIDNRIPNQVRQRVARVGQRVAGAGQILALAVDRSGQLTVQSVEDPEFQAVRLERTLRLPGLIVLHLAARQPRPNRRQAWRVVIARDAVSVDEWRSLGVWLEWLARGPRNGQ